MRFLYSFWRQNQINEVVDNGYYINSYPDVRASGMDPSKHFLSFGWREGRNPSKNFHTLYYAAKYMNGQFGLQNPIDHYLGLPSEIRSKITCHPVDQEDWISIQKDVIADYFDIKYYTGLYWNYLGETDATEHYLKIGWRRGYNPSAKLNGSELLSKVSHLLSTDVAPLYYLAVTRQIEPLRIQQSQCATQEILSILASEFDAEWYAENYPEYKDSGLPPFQYYATIGIGARHSPNENFSEEFYLAFYADIRDAVEKKRLPCGFYHYLMAGRREDRLPKHDLAGALEAVLPGVTLARLQANADDIEQRLRPINGIVADGPRTIWCFLPRLNPDIFFGGYKAFLEFLLALDRSRTIHECAIALVTTEEFTANAAYCIWQMKGSPFADFLKSVTVRGRGEISELIMSARDRFVAYSSWDALLASPLAARTDEPRVISFIQEYEPIFHDFSALHSFVNQGFEIPSFPIFNTACLRDYFASNRYGLFKSYPEAIEGVDYLCFEHVFNILPLQDRKAMESKTTRLCTVYARPEGHAARNLYEIALLALRKLCAEGTFDSRWSFVGLGALAERDPVPLDRKHHLDFIQKMPEAEYVDFASSIDLGISLMYAPHPSVVPFEFATTGAIVVTNTFENRSPDFFAEISGNIVPCAPDLDGVMRAIRTAVCRVEEFDRRYEMALRPSKRSWKDVFGADFVHMLPLGRARGSSASCVGDTGKTKQASRVNATRQVGS